MTEFYKLLFDLSLWYCLGGYFLRLAAGKTPYVPGFLALCLCAGLDAFLRAKKPEARWARITPLLLPLLTLIWRPGLWPALHLLVAWAYVAFCIWTDRVELRYDGARSHFGFGLKTLLLLILGPLFPENLGAAAIQSVPYLVLMLTAGICLLRMLREQRPAGLQQGIYMAVFVLLCALLTLGKAPQLLLRLVGIVYRNVLSPLIFCLAIVMGALFYGFYLVMKWLVDRAQGRNEPLQLELSGTAEALGLGEQYEAYTADLRWLKTLLIALGAAVLCFLLWRLFRRLLGERAAAGDLSRRPDRTARLKYPAAAPGRRLLRPREPRAAVRWYFARFLDECARRGLTVPKGMTVEELCAASAGLFPAAEVETLCAVYCPARYQPGRRVTPEDVKRAAEAWSILKKSESKKSP